MRERTGPILAAALVAAVATAPAGRTQEWVGTWDGPSAMSDIGSRVAVDAAGSVAVAGSTLTPFSGRDVGIVLFDAAGDFQWEAIWPGPGSTNADVAGIDRDSAGCVILSCNAIGTSGTLDIIVLKYDASGNLLWSYEYNGPGNAADSSYGNTLIVNAADEIYFCGASYVGGGDTDGVLVKLSAAGSLLWEHYSTGTPGGYDSTDMLDHDGSLGVVVSTFITGPVDYGWTVSHLDAAGNLLWETVCDTAGVEELPYAIAVDPSGNVSVAGVSWSGAGDEDVLVTRLDSAGNLQWASTYDGSAGDTEYAFAVAADDQGNTAVTGYSDLGTDACGLTLLYDSGGNLAWAQCHDPDPIWWGGDTWGTGVEFDAEGNVWVSMNGYANPYVGFEGVTALYSVAGSLLKLWTYNGPVSGNDSLFSLDLDDAGNGYAAGLTLNSSGDLDFLVVRYDRPYLTLKATPAVVVAGDTLQFSIKPGTVGAVAMLAVLDVSGSPLFLPLRTGPFDSAGAWGWSPVVPGGLAGLTVTFGGFGQDQWGTITAAPPAIVSFQ